MVAYSFKKRFGPDIHAGIKRQTIRADRVRHARPGEMLQLFTGMRTTQCKKICEDVRCTEVAKIEIFFDADGDIESIWIDGTAVKDVDDFAKLDGFSDASEMADFWHEENSQGPNTVFQGALIKWEPPIFDPMGWES